MLARFALGLDLGGGGVRALLLDLERHRTAAAARPFASERDPEAPGGYRFDPREAWRVVCEAVAEARARAGAEPAQIGAVAAASMRHGSVLLDAAGSVLLAAPNRDARGFAPAAAWAAAHGETLQRRTGRWPQSIHPASRLRGLATQAPDLYERVATHLSISDWLAFELCGERATEATQAGETLVFDLAARNFADDLVRLLDLPRAIFPPALEPGAALGRVRPAAAEALGIAKDARVCVGGADTQCALAGAGALGVGAWCVVAGSTAPLQAVVPEPLVDARLWTGHAPSRGRFVLESNAGGVGEALDWVAGALYAYTAHPLLHLLADAAGCRAGAGGIVSTVAGDVMDARALALPLGAFTLSPLAGADGSGRRALLARAALEGAAFALRANARQIVDAVGAPPERLVAAGGLSRSALFTQLLADVTGCAVEVPAEPLATALGAALCAAVGAGAYPDLDAAARAAVRVARRHDPEPEAAAAHRASFEVWSALRAGETRAAATGHALRHLAASAPVAAPRNAPRPRVLVASDIDDASLAALRAVAEVEYASFRQAGRLLRGDALVRALEGVQVFVTEIDVVEAAALVRCRDLRAIAVCRGDAVNVDLAACTALGIPVVHTPGRNADAVADLCVAFLLMLARKLPEASAFLREPGGKAGDLGRMGRAFATFQGRELWRRSVGLVGLGAVGRKVLARLAGFGASVLAYDPLLSDDAVRLAGAEPASFEDLLARSDFVSLHAAVTEGSRGLIGRAQLAAMRAGACLVNTARAALVDEEALAEALRSGHLAGAALDVFSVEPPGADHPLLALPNVIATPHVGGNTRDVAAHQGAIVVSELEDLLAGRPPRHCLNPGTLAGFSWTAPRPEPRADLLAQLPGGPGPAVSDLMRDAARPERKS